MPSSIEKMKFYDELYWFPNVHWKVAVDNHGYLAYIDGWEYGKPEIAKEGLATAAEAYALLTKTLRSWRPSIWRRLTDAGRRLLEQEEGR
jgi:hypothetical protein